MCVCIFLDVHRQFLDLIALTSGMGKWKARVQGERGTHFLLEILFNCLHFYHMHAQFFYLKTLF